jgi:hypothetical protein
LYHSPTPRRKKNPTIVHWKEVRHWGKWTSCCSWIVPTS